MRLYRNYLALFFLLVLGFLQAKSYPYKVPGNDEEYFLNPLVNYAFTYDTEKYNNSMFYKNSSIKLTYGSLLNYQLLKDEVIVLNLPLNEKLTFSANYRNYITRHLMFDKEEARIGLRYKLNDNFSLVGNTQLESGKDLIDVGAGILFEDSKDNYFSSIVSFDDFIYDMKNLNEGLNNFTPISITSKLNYSNSKLYLFSEVNYSTGFEREFPQDTLAIVSELNYHKMKNCDYKFDFGYEIAKNMNLYSKVFFNQFNEEKHFNNLDSSYYKMESDFISIELGMDQKFSRSSLRYGMIYAKSNQDKIGGYPESYYYEPDYTYNFKVSAVIPYLFYTYNWNENFQIEPGLLVQVNKDNEGTNPWGSTYLLHLEYNDMLKLGVRYKFDNKSFIYASIGHLFNSGNFGGGNVRFVKYF
ncbi:MAG: hypothetical protein PF638_01890 [Candidatus Delongbacteria bacterium]|nr:hypothetical protein [Candidatus Delongbacteria bacterium]